MVQGELFSDAQHATEPVVQPTPQIAYRWQKGVLTIDDPHAAVIVGFLPDSFTFDSGLKIADLGVSYPPDMPFADPSERYAAFAAVSTDGQPLADSKKVLLSAVSMSFNDGFEIDLEKFAANKQYGHALGKCSPSMGGLPILTARVSAVLHAPWLKNKKFRFVDFNRNTLDKGRIENNCLTIPADQPVFLIEITAP